MEHAKALTAIRAALRRAAETAPEPEGAIEPFPELDSDPLAVVEVGRNVFFFYPSHVYGLIKMPSRRSGRLPRLGRRAVTVQLRSQHARLYRYDAFTLAGGFLGRFWVRPASL